MREEFLKREHPAIYRHLMKSGELMEYLEGYQQAYSKRAATLDAELSKERGLMERDPDNRAPRPEGELFAPVLPVSKGCSCVITPLHHRKCT